MKTKWNQGKYIPINKSKCININEPIFRSSWEKKFMYYCDVNKNIIKWGSEIIIIPYYYDVDGKWHKYYVDFYIEVLKKDGLIDKCLIEIKPDDQNTESYSNGYPNPPKKKTQKSLKNYHDKVKTIRKNICKWDAAKKYCDKMGYKWVVINKKTLML